MKSIITMLSLIFLFLFPSVFARENPQGTPSPKPPEEPKNYTYFIKRGGLFRYEKGHREKEEAYIKIGMKKSDMIYLNDIKTLDFLVIEYEGNYIKNIWVMSENIKTEGGLGVGSSMELFKNFQPVSIGGSLQSYSPPYSGIVFCSTKNPGMVDAVLISSSSISAYSSGSGNRNPYSTYVLNGTGEVVKVMDEIITTLYTSLNMQPSFLQEVILLPGREELGKIWALYGGTNKPVTSFCVNDVKGGVIYAVCQGEIDSKTRGILAHEYAHVWHYRLIGYDEKNQFIREGFAEWVRYHYEGTSFQYSSEKDYADGLNFFLEIERKKGASGVFKYLVEKK